MYEVLYYLRSMSYECDLCKRIFDYPSILKLHCRSHTGEKPFRCEVCSKTFSYEAYLIVHKQTHIQNEEFIGRLDNDVLLQEAALEEQTELHTGESKEEACEIKGFFKKNDLDRQNDSLREDRPPTFVTYFEEFSKESDLKHQNQTCIEIEHHICELCNDAFLQKSALDEHVKLHTNERRDETRGAEGFTFENGLDYENSNLKQSKLHKCFACNNVFSKKCDLDRHFLSHKNGKPLSGKEMCGETSSRMSKLTTSNNNRKKQKSFVCDLCCQSFSLKELLHKHHRIHSNEKPFICNKAFSRKSTLGVHHLMHTNEKPFKCDIRDQSFLHKGNLNQHYGINSNEKLFICDICDKAFSQKGSLNRHYRIHSNEKPFECDTCDKSFSQKGSLNRHYRIHSNEKPFECDICDKSFSQKGNLNQHYRIHSNEKPFECDTCGKRFSRKNNLKHHHRVHTFETLCASEEAIQMSSL